MTHPFGNSGSARLVSAALIAKFRAGEWTPAVVSHWFSDTAVRIFVLRASRRLNSDRFFTND